MKKQPDNAFGLGVIIHLVNGIWLRMAILLSLSIIVYFHYVFVWWEKGGVIIGKSIQTCSYLFNLMTKKQSYKKWHLVT